MIRRFLLIMVLVILHGAFMTINGDEPQKPPRFRTPDEIFVRFQPNTTESEMEAFANRYQEYGLTERWQLNKGMSLYTTKRYFYDKSLIDGKNLLDLIILEYFVFTAGLYYGVSPNHFDVEFRFGVADDEVTTLLEKYSEFELRLDYRYHHHGKDIGRLSFNSKLADYAYVRYHLVEEEIIDFIHPIVNITGASFIPPDPYFPQQTYFSRIKMPQTWTLLNSFQGNARTKVAAVIDRGFYNSRELIDGRAVNWGEFAPRVLVPYMILPVLV